MVLTAIGAVSGVSVATAAYAIPSNLDWWQWLIIAIVPSLISAGIDYLTKKLVNKEVISEEQADKIEKMTDDFVDVGIDLLEEIFSKDEDDTEGGK